MNDLLPFEQHLSIITDVETLAHYLLHQDENVTLSPKLQEKLQRLEKCKDLIKKYRSRYKVVSQLQDIPFKKTNGDTYKISKAQAYRDYSDTVELFNTTSEVAGLDFYVDLLLGDIAETRAKAMEKQDFKTVATCDRNSIEVLKTFFGGQEAKEYRKLQPPMVFTDFIPEKFKDNLPDGWEKHVQKLIGSKSKKAIVEDAQYVEDKPAS